MTYSVLQSYNGLIRFYDGTVIAIEDQEYSPDGILNWEKVFNPNSHISTLDGVTIIEGHKYKRVQHSGDTTFQLPYRIVPEEPVFRVQDGILQYKLETQADTAWKDLLDTDTLKGEDGVKGDQGIPGQGFHIDLYGFYKLRPDCVTAAQSLCQSCNPGSNTTSTAVTFMSLGDGVLVLTSALIAAGTVTVDLVAYTHFSNDLVTWTALTGGIVDFEARYLATDGTGAVYTDMRDEDYYGTRGTVYVCVENRWTVLANVATPSYMVGETLGSTNIGFLDHFVTAPGILDFIDDTISIENGILKIVQESLDNTSFSADVFNYGLDYIAGTGVEVDPADFKGFGIESYIADSDSKVKLQVIVDDFLGDGTRIQAAADLDNELRNLLGVDITDLINNDSGLIAVAQGDTFNDLVVNIGDGLTLDGDTPQGITIDVDDLSLVVDSASLRVKTYSAGNDGILSTHLNPTVAWTNQGLALDSANGLYVRVDASTIGYSGSGLLQIPDNGVTGAKLNDDVADETKGVEIASDKLTVKVDNTSIGFDLSGNLTAIAPGNVVEGIVVKYNSGAIIGSLDHNVTMNFIEGTGIELIVSATGGAVDTMELTVGIDESWLQTTIEDVIQSQGSATVYWGALAQSSGSATTIAQYITALNHASLDTLYSNVEIRSGIGLVIKSSGGNEFKLIVDDQGNLDTQAIV